MVKFDDPHASADPLYECTRCGARVASETHVGVCPECGGHTMKNIAVARE